MMLRFFQSRAGFTLIELMIVMSIVGILMTIAQPSYRKATFKAREAVLKSDLATFRDVLDQYYADQAVYPNSLNDLVENHYLRGLPIDPFTHSADTWIEVYLEAGEEEDGIFDVHSGSDLVALDGTPYNEW